MKIYDKTNFIYTRYGRYGVIKNKLLYKIGSLLGLDYITLKQFIYKNRPFKVLNYSLSLKFINSINKGVLIRQEIITNNRYRPITRKENCLSINYLIHDINSKSINCSKLDIQMLYRILNHFLYKNKINSI